MWLGGGLGSVLRRRQPRFTIQRPGEPGSGKKTQSNQRKGAKLQRRKDLRRLGSRGAAFMSLQPPTLNPESSTLNQFDECRAPAASRIGRALAIRLSLAPWPPGLNWVFDVGCWMFRSLLLAPLAPGALALTPLNGSPRQPGQTAQKVISSRSKPEIESEWTTVLLLISGLKSAPCYGVLAAKLSPGQCALARLPAESCA
jgi:hypothetical protein